MRNTILILSLVTSMAGSAGADPHDEKCAALALLAEATMQSRQAGVSLSQMLGIIETDDSAAIFRTITLDAYDRPRMNMAENQQRMISDFRDEWHLLCMKAGG